MAVTLVFGVIGVVIAGLAGSLGKFIEAALRSNSILGGPLVGVFLLGRLSRRARANPAFAGLWVGLVVAIGLDVFTAVLFVWYFAFSAWRTLGLASC